MNEIELLNQPEDKIDWSKICYSQNLSENFIDKFHYIVFMVELIDSSEIEVMS